jgi:hypothetical protein
MVGGEPVHTLTPVGIVAALVLLALFCVINAIGVKFFTQINNVLVWWKLAVIALVVVLFLVTTFHGANFTSHGFAPSGGKAMFTAISTSGITFSYLGFRQAIELAGESNDPKRNVPFAVIGSVVICMVVYVLLQIAFIAALSGGDLAHGWSELSFTNDFGPLAAVSTAIGLGWLATILYIDAVVSPGDTGLIYSAVTARLGYTMARNGNAPQAIGRLSTRGVPWVSLLITFVVAAIMLLPFPSWQQLVGLVTSATVMSFASAVGRRRHPAARLLLGQHDHLLDRLEDELEVLHHHRLRVRADGDLRRDRPAQVQDGLEGRRLLGDPLAGRHRADQLPGRLRRRPGRLHGPREGLRRQRRLERGDLLPRAQDAAARRACTREHRRPPPRRGRVRGRPGDLGMTAVRGPSPETGLAQVRHR